LLPVFVPALRILIAGLILAWTKSQKGTRLATVDDGVRLVQSQHVGGGNQRSDPGRRAKRADLGVAFGQLLNLPIHPRNLRV
jgi:hypothetical protein